MNCTNYPSSTVHCDQASNQLAFGYEFNRDTGEDKERHQNQRCGRKDGIPSRSETRNQAPNNVEVMNIDEPSARLS